MEFLGQIRWTRWSVGALLLLSYCHGLRKDELACEEAAARLSECCSSWTGSIDCRYVYSTGCGTSEDMPLSVHQSRCIQRMSCSEIEQRGLCTAELHGKRSYTPDDPNQDTASVEPETKVCP